MARRSNRLRASSKTKKHTQRRRSRQITPESMRADVYDIPSSPEAEQRTTRCTRNKTSSLLTSKATSKSKIPERPDDTSASYGTSSSNCGHDDDEETYSIFEDDETQRSVHETSPELDEECATRECIGAFIDLSINDDDVYFAIDSDDDDDDCEAELEERSGKLAKNSHRDHQETIEEWINDRNVEDPVPEDDPDMLRFQQKMHALIKRITEHASSSDDKETKAWIP
ncbi:hypothetical protein BHE90_011692 [Fusarium euwallaceae]|uniref:Uncharacterized protein n=1 Tax=Fusarium euwallaceae TaxID=1147111 RepID=A0A430LDS1_9HYPO|nr:hypothetical protein BHE90_011692 [Fusarium euwallaceae]